MTGERRITMEEARWAEDAPAMQTLLELLCARADDARPLPPTLVIVAHPDDEVIGAGARLRRLRTATLVHVTDGAPRRGRDAEAQGFASREAYAQARRGELAAALAAAGVSGLRTRELGFADQEATHRLVELTLSIEQLIQREQPLIVLTHPYEGGHPDHDATAFAVHAACARGRVKRFAILEMTSYHVGPNGILPGEFLPAPSGEADAARAITLTLDAHERELKQRVMACFTSQQGTLQYFGVEQERFRPAPRYDFTRPPHEGKLFYEYYEWGMTGERFRSLAREAMEQLGVEGAI